MHYTLEVCVDSTASALAAKRGGCWEPQPVFVSEEKATGLLVEYCYFTLSRNRTKPARPASSSL